MKGTRRKKQALDQKYPDHLHKLIESWRQLNSIDVPGDPFRLAPDAPRFVEYAWKTFNAKLVLEIIISKEPFYKALKPILFSGFCTWVICPTRRSLRQHGMLLVGIAHLQQAEIKGREIFSHFDVPSPDLLGDLIGRISQLGQDFYSDFYYPIGGITQVLRSTNPANFSRSLSHHSTAVKTIVSMMEIYDYHVRYLSNSSKYYKASEGKGYALVKAIGGNIRRETGVSIENSEIRWKNLKSNAALIYSASTIKTENGSNLLQIICSGRARYEEHGHLIQAWIGRARHASEVILGNFTKPEIARDNLASLPDFSAEATPEPVFTRPEQERIEAAFNKATSLKGRRRTERQSTVSESI